VYGGRQGGEAWELSVYSRARSDFALRNAWSSPNSPHHMDGASFSFSSASATTIITTTTTITSSQTSRSALACVGLFDGVDVDVGVNVKRRGGGDGPLHPPLCPAQPVL
jgi:hypothetical protein